MDRVAVMRKRRTAYRRSRHAFLAVGIATLPILAVGQQATQSRLEEIVVTTSIVETPRRQIATAVSVISAEDIELRGYNSIADVLRTQPGIGVSNNGGTGKATALRIRGEEGYRTLLMIDGVKASDPSATQVGPSFASLLTTGDLERVEILRGPQGFIYGADAGGVVNILTRTGQGNVGGRLGLEYGAHGTSKIDASVSGGSDNGDYFVSVTDLDTDGFNAQTADSVLMDDDGAENTTLHTKLGWNVTENLRLQIVARDVDASTMFDRCFSPISFSTTHDCVGTTEQTTYKVSADHETGNFKNVFGFSEVDIARDNLSDGVSSFATEGELSRFEYTGSFNPSEALTLVYGLDLQTEEVVSDELRERDQDAYYVEYQGRFGDNFYVSAGARHDDNEDFGSHTSARLSAAYIQELGRGSSLKYRASLGTGFRAPSLFEVAYNRGPFAFPPASNVVLTEESSEGYDIGIELDAPSGLHFEATYFDQEIEDEIFFDLDSFSGYLQSVGIGSSKGVEVAVQAPVGERWEILGNWTSNDSEDTDNTQRLRRPENLGNIGFTYTSTDEKLRVLANYRVSRDAIDIGNVPLDDYEVLDVSLSYSFSDLLELYGRVENATDEEYQEIVGFNTAGRSAFAGVRLRFQ